MLKFPISKSYAESKETRSSLNKKRDFSYLRKIIFAKTDFCVAKTKFLEDWFLWMRHSHFFVKILSSRVLGFKTIKLCALFIVTKDIWFWSIVFEKKKTKKKTVSVFSLTADIDLPIHRVLLISLNFGA